MGLLYYLKSGKAQSLTESCKYHLRHCFSYACILSAFVLLCPANAVYGQLSLLDKVISIPKQNTTLYEALNLISQKADCSFIYESETIESNKRVKLHAENQPLGKVLDNLLSDPRLEYKILGRHILIYRAGKEVNPAITIQPDIPAKDTIKNVLIKGHIYDR